MTNLEQQLASPIIADTAVLEERLERWKTRLNALTELQLPTDYPRRIHPHSHIHVVEAEKTYAMPEDLCTRLKQLASDMSREIEMSPVTPFTLVLSAFVILVHRYCGEDDIVVGSTSGVNPRVLRLAVSGALTFADVVRHVKEVEEDAARHEIPFDHLLKSLPASSAAALTKLRFFDHTSAHSLSTSPVSPSTTSPSSHHASDLTLFLSQSLHIRFVYNTLLFNEDRMNEMNAQLQSVLDAAARNRHRVIDALDLVTPLSRQRLPDPTAVLTQWESAWPGPIHLLFMRHALKFPQDPCVIESHQGEVQTLAKDDPTSEETKSNWKTFTYAHINQTSNQVALTLLKGGIAREDVVIIYAHRGVELVIAILGVLKAGATFSVLDPLYPTSRQTLYLSVARPRGLIVLARAGELDTQVESYLRSNQDFELKCRLSGLQIDSQLRLTANVEKVGHPLKPLEPVPNDNEVNLPEIGPDSIGTLSFTSGSTGVPKGVRGRHFSLTHFYPWMEQRFGISSADRFTMLSGIAHDPIQRDIFTPLFFGAQVHIPTAEDIGQPGRLAEWLAEHACTITHLTPAMGQLVSANAVQPIPALRHAFFVGDILTKRDVTRLQALAPNVSVINMYGTTETQRAVSHYVVPPSSSSSSCTTTGGPSLSHLKEVIPAGEGMKGVQLILVNPQRRLCGVGEIGEIYVRSMGLAEGYLLREEDTAAKFVYNFFISPSDQPSSAKNLKNLDRGPRDRMYRTGDLGRYRPDGVVECCGRSDDQVKIRGFRIELGEIDTHLSQHPCVRENVTLVRRDAYEEKTLVSYFVPNQEGLLMLGGGKVADLQTVIQAIRDDLKLKLPSYSVPSLLVPLIRMPLTPNGKIDKNALPYPNTAVAVTSNESERGSPETMSPLETRLVDMWSFVLFPPPPSPVVESNEAPNPPKGRRVNLDENFFDLGGHSILATRLIFEIRRQLKLEGDKVPLTLLFNHPTVRKMAAEIEKNVGFGIADVDTLGAVADALTQKVDSSTAPLDLSSEVELPPFILKSATSELPFVFDQPSYQNTTGEFVSRSVFLTGVTGFLGAFLLDSLLKEFPTSTVHCLVRARSQEEGWSRLLKNMENHLLWKSSNDNDFKSRTKVVCGDLAQPWLGLGVGNEVPVAFQLLADSIDCVVHNGAFVHWVYPYSTLKPANVNGTLEALKLCLLGKGGVKPFHFVSSTSVLDSDAYTERTTAVFESDDLEGSRCGLKSGYGQSKWVAEKLLMLARRGGQAVGVGSSKTPVQLPITIIRPGYIVGDSQTGVTNADDFLWRLCKGCVQLGQVPVMANVVNMCPVDFVAQTIVKVVRGGRAAVQKGVFHIWNPSRVRFQDLFRELQLFGYDQLPSGLAFKPYLAWRDALMHLTMEGKDNALYPLLHFVLDDLPTSTKSPSLDWRNVRWLLQGTSVQCAPITEKREDSLLSDSSESELDESESEMDGRKQQSRREKPKAVMERYLTYLCEVGFLPWPPGRQPTTSSVKAELLVRSGRTA